MGYAQIESELTTHMEKALFCSARKTSFTGLAVAIIHYGATGYIRRANAGRRQVCATPYAWALAPGLGLGVASATGYIFLGHRLQTKEKL